MFSTYERLFSWWHVLHVPFVYMLIPVQSNLIDNINQHFILCNVFIESEKFFSCTA